MEKYFSCPYKSLSAVGKYFFSLYSSLREVQSYLFSLYKSVFREELSCIPKVFFML